MERDFLLKQAPTAQVRYLAEEMLSDGRVHSRKELTDYIKTKASQMGLAPFREGHLAGGIREATTNLECIKVNRGEFQMASSVQIVQTQEEITMGQRMALVCEDAIARLTDISKEIVFVSASAEEVKMLEKVRGCIEVLKEYQEVFKTE